MTEAFDPLKLENQICFPLYVCAKEVIRRYKPFLDELDLTYTQYIAMMVFWEYRSLSVKDLGAHLYLDSGTLTPMLKTLEKKGYVHRERSDKDERVVIVSVTDAGMALREKAPQVPMQVGHCINLSAEDGAALYEILNRLQDSLRENA